MIDLRVALTAVALGWAGLAGAQALAPAATTPGAASSGAPTQSGFLAITQGIGESDNIFDTASDRVSQTYSVTELGLSYNRQGSALTANVNGDFSYLDYLQGAYDGQWFGRFDGRTGLSLWDERLKWVLQDDFGQTQLDLYGPLVPSNLQFTNLLLTGPDLTLRPAEQTLLKLSARYALSTYQVSPFDGWRSLENAGIERELSAHSSLSLNADFMQMHFDQAGLNPDYDNNQYYVHYSIAGARTQVTTSLGVAQDNFGGGWFTTPYAAFEATRQMAHGMSLTLSAGRQITDSGDAFGDLRAGAAGGVVTALTTVTMAPYVENYAAGGWTYSGLRTSLGVTARWERDTYASAALAGTYDLNQGNVQVFIARHLTPHLTAELRGGYTTARYFELGFNDDYYTASGDIAWQFARTLTVTVRFDHNTRSASGGTFGYDENRGLVTLTYKPVQSVPTADLVR